SGLSVITMKEIVKASKENHFLTSSFHHFLGPTKLDLKVHLLTSDVLLARTSFRSNRDYAIGCGKFVVVQLLAKPSCARVD
ncbi:MAG: hypothetical protein ACFFCW_49830, partial [Candidatus Hodarchaeota archaeon]